MDQVVNKAKALLFLVISLFFLLFILGWVWKVNSQEIRFKKGEITSLEIDSQTVVVEVPLGSQYYTVGGSLSSTTILKKRAGERPASGIFMLVMLSGLGGGKQKQVIG